MESQIEVFEQMMMDYLKGALSPEDKPRFLELLRSDEIYRRKYREMSRTYALATSSWFAQRKEQNLNQLREKLNLRSSRKHTIRRHLWIWSSAAVWMVLLVCGWTLWKGKEGSRSLAGVPVYCQLEVPQGATSRVLLPDSTVVVLNGGTQLKYDARWQELSQREVFLSGEAYFQVTKHDHKPFVVHADELNVKVMGTTFNVASYPDEETVQVSLLEGSVQVYTASDTPDNRWLSPNQQAVYHKDKGSLTVQPIDASAQVAWTTGKLVFINEKLYDILKTIGKRWDVQMMVQSQKVHEEFFSGTIRLDMTLEEILSYLDVDNKFVWRKKGKTWVIADR